MHSPAMSPAYSNRSSTCAGFGSCGVALIGILVASCSTPSLHISSDARATIAACGGGAVTRRIVRPRARSSRTRREVSIAVESVIRLEAAFLRRARSAAEARQLYELYLGCVANEQSDSARSRSRARPDLPAK